MVLSSCTGLCLCIASLLPLVLDGLSSQAHVNVALSHEFDPARHHWPSSRLYLVWPYYCFEFGPNVFSSQNGFDVTLKDLLAVITQCSVVMIFSWVVAHSRMESGSLVTSGSGLCFLLFLIWSWGGGLDIGDRRVGAGGEKRVMNRSDDEVDIILRDGSVDSGAGVPCRRFEFRVPVL